jgi:hypothetical protein
MEREVAALRAEVAMLQSQINGVTKVVEGLALALTTGKLLQPKDIEQAVLICGLHAWAEADDATALPSRCFLSDWHAFHQDEADPRLALILRTLMLLQAGDRREALKQWLGYATPEEVAQELGSLLATLGRTAPP